MRKPDGVKPPYSCSKKRFGKLETMYNKICQIEAPFPQALRARTTGIRQTNFQRIMSVR